MTDVTEVLLNDVATACRRTGIGRTMMYELLSSGAIESVRLGGRRLIPEDSLRGFVERLRSEQASQPFGGTLRTRSGGLS